MDIDIGCHRPLHAQQKADTTNTTSYRNLWMAACHRCSNQNKKNNSKLFANYPIEPFLLQDFDSNNKDPATRIFILCI